jgi:hypothetical protein
MSLTGTPFQWLTITIAIVATIAVITLWNKIRGPQPARVAGRIVLLATSYLTTAVAVLVSINIAYGGLIATWGDLFDNLQAPQGGWTQHYHHHGHRHGPPSMQTFLSQHHLPWPTETTSTPLG